MVNNYPIWGLNDAQVNIGEFWTFRGGHGEVIVGSRKEVLEEVHAGLGTQEVICGASKY